MNRNTVSTLIKESNGLGLIKALPNGYEITDDCFVNPPQKDTAHAVIKCSSLEMITFEKGSKLESISGVRDLGAFDGAINLTTVDMSECTQVKRIDEYTFYGNSNLRLFKIGTEIPPTCKDYTFYNINPYSVLKVPSGCTDAYKKATGWKKFASITGLDE